MGREEEAIDRSEGVETAGGGRGLRCVLVELWLVGTGGGGMFSSIPFDLGNRWRCGWWIAEVCMRNATEMTRKRPTDR